MELLDSSYLAETIPDLPECFTTTDGLITLRLDQATLDACIDARRGYRPSAMAEVLRIAHRLGLEPLDDDECDPEILEDSTIRIHCALIDGGTLNDRGLAVWS